MVLKLNTVFTYYYEGMYIFICFQSCMDTSKYIEIINQSILTINSTLNDRDKIELIDEDRQEDMVIKLDSLGLVNFFFDLESRLSRELKKDVSLLNENFYEKPEKILRSFESLLKYIKDQLHEE